MAGAAFCIFWQVRMNFRIWFFTLLSMVLILKAEPSAAQGSLRCENLFQQVPLHLHSVIYLRAKSDERVGTRRFNYAQQLANRVTVMNGRLYYKGQVLDTSNGTAGGIHRRGIQIFGLDRDMNLVTSPHAPVDVIHHSTLTGAEAGYFFGEWKVREGKIVMISNMSGHFRPSVRQLHAFVRLLRSLDVFDPSLDIVEIEPDPNRD